MKTGYAVLTASLILSAASRRRSDRFPAALAGASVGHFLRGFSAEFERGVDSNQEGDADRPAGAYYGGAWRDVRDRNRWQCIQPEDRPDPERPLPLKQKIREAACAAVRTLIRDFKKLTRGSTAEWRVARRAREVGSDRRAAIID